MPIGGMAHARVPSSAAADAAGATGLESSREPQSGTGYGSAATKLTLWCLLSFCLWPGLAWPVRVVLRGGTDLI